MILLLAFPQIATALPQEDIPNAQQGNFDVQKPVLDPVELPLFIRSNCYAYTEYVLGDLPPMAEIQKTATKAFGSVAVFDYNGIPHVAVVNTVAGYGYFTITESNFGVDAVTTRDVSFTDPHLVGFYSPL